MASWAIPRNDSPPRGRPHARTPEGEGQVVCGDAVLRALDTARRQEERGHEAWARFTQAQIERAAGSPFDTVASRYGSALELAELCDMRPLAALCRFRLGAAQLECAQPREARALLDEARHEFRIMGMAGWLDQADRLSGART